MAWRCWFLTARRAASTAASSPRNDLVKNYRVHPTDWLISTQALVPLKPFEDLVSLMHGGTPKAHLHLFASLFGDKTHVRFPELIRACCACPVLLRPLRLFHLQMRVPASRDLGTAVI